MPTSTNPRFLNYRFWSTRVDSDRFILGDVGTQSLLDMVPLVGGMLDLESTIEIGRLTYLMPEFGMSSHTRDVYPYKGCYSINNEFTINHHCL